MQPGDRLLGTFLLNVWIGARGSLFYLLAGRECWVSGLFRFALGGDFGNDDTVQVLLGALFTFEHGAVQSTGGPYRYIRGRSRRIILIACIQSGEVRAHILLNNLAALLLRCGFLRPERLLQVQGSIKEL